MNTDRSGRTKQVAQNFPSNTDNSITSGQNVYGNAQREEIGKYSISFEGSEDQEPRKFIVDSERTSLHKYSSDYKASNENQNGILSKGANSKEQKNSYEKIAALRASEEEMNLSLANKSASALISSNKVPPGWERNKTSPKTHNEGTTPKSWGTQPTPGFGGNESKKRNDQAGSFESSNTSPDEFGNRLEDPLLRKRRRTSIESMITNGYASDDIDKCIDIFIKNLDAKKDWSRLREILREKFEGMNPNKCMFYLKKFKKMVKKIDSISTDIMEKNIEVYFIDKPLRSTMEEIASSETSVMNFLRDMAWAPLTYHTTDIFLSQADTTWATQTITQTVISMIVMAIGAAIYHFVKNRVVKKDPEEEVEPKMITFLKVVFIWLGAGLAIPSWNALQVVGDNIGMNFLGLSSMNAGFFSSLFPGIPEGPTQGIASIISAFTLSHTWHKFKWTTFLQQLAIFATLGAVPGDIWQLAYQVITGPIETADNMPDWAITIVLGLGLAVAVYIGNVGFGTWYERVINRSHLVIEIDVIEESVIMDDIIDEDADNIVSYNGRPGAPNHNGILIVKQEHHSGHHDALYDQFGHHHDPSNSHHHHHDQIDEIV